MIVIGLTGNIACGKSTVGRMLEQLGAQRIDADLVVHEQMAPGKPVWQGIVNAFGREILNPDQTINRAKLGGIVFGSPEALRRLEAITHPAAYQLTSQRIAECSADVVVVEAVKLIEAGWQVLCDAIWFVTCSLESQLERMQRDRGMTEVDARARLSAQPAVEEKLRMADVVIDNSASLDETMAQVKRGLEAARVANGAVKRSGD